MSYEDLLDSIETAQRDAGEQAVIAHPRKQGLIDSEQTQPTAGAESAQIATESVAAFTHTPKAGEIPNGFPGQLWFSFGISHARGEVKGIKLFLANKNEKHVSLEVQVGIVERATVGRVLTADQCEALARNLIDAAHHLRTFQAKVPA
jgi:hypothetical protein